MASESITLNLSDGSKLDLPRELWRDLLHSNRAAVLEVLGVTEDHEDKPPVAFSVRRDADGEPRLVVHRT